MTTLTGILRDSGGNPITGTLWLEISQAGTFSPGAILVTPLQPSVFNLTAGSISGPGGGPYSVYGNDGITPSITFYRLTAFDAAGSQVLRLNVLLTGASADLGTIVIAPTQSWVSPPGYILSLGGDVTGPSTAANVGKIQGKAVAPPPWTPGHVMTVQADQSLAPAAPTAPITDAELSAIAGLTSAADRLPYFTGLGAAALATFTAWGRSLVAAVDAAATRTLLALGTAALVNVPASGDAAATEVVKGSDSRLPGPLILTPEKFGGAGDGRTNSAGAMTSGSAVLTLSGTGGSFTAGSVGKTIAVEGAGASSGLLVTTIASYTSPTQVTLSAAAGTTCVGGWVYWGTNNSAAYASMNAAVIAGCRILFSAGDYVSTTALTISDQNCMVIGAGRAQTTLTVLSTTADGIAWSVAGTGQIVQDLQIRGMGGLMTSGAGIGYTGGAFPYWGSAVRGVFIDRMYDGIRSSNVGSYLELTNIRIFRPVRYGFYVNGSSTVTTALVYAYETFYGDARFGMSSGGTTVTATTATFSAHNIGDLIIVNGAAGGGQALETRITSVASSTSCTVANAASANVSTQNGGIGSQMDVGWYQTNGGVYMSTIDIVGGRKSFYLAPGNGELIFPFEARNLLCDSPRNIGFQVANSGTGKVRNMKFTGCWFASASAQYNIAGMTGIGVYMSVAGADIIEHVIFNGCEFINNVVGAASIQWVCGLTIANSLFENGAAAGGQELYLIAGRDVAITGNRFTAELYGVTNDYCINMGGFGGAIAITGNVFRAYAVSATVNVTHNGTSIIVANNAALP